MHKEDILKRITENHDVRIFTENIEETALMQLETLLSLGAFSECKIRIMPDVHAGAGCVIGFTGDLGDKVSQILWVSILVAEYSFNPFLSKRL